jgi:predicted RNase H-like HicB family nuclease
MSTYHVVFERDEAGYWVASVREVAGCNTQGRSIQQARQRIREALSLFIEEKVEGAIQFVEEVKLPKEVRSLVGKTKAAREKAEAAAKTAQQSTKKTVEFLTCELKLSVRDVGELLGLSHQRVQQLLN